MTTETFSEQIERARKDLLDFSLRNPLLNYRLLRGRGVEAIDADPATVFDLLVRQGRAITFTPDFSLSEQETGLDEESDEAQLSFLPKADKGGPKSSRRSNRRAENRLSTSVSEEQLFRRLLNTFRTHRTIIEEQGVNTLYLALGMVQWYEDDSSNQVRKAPLILVPVTIDRLSVEDEFQISYDEREVGQNISFIEKVKLDFGIDLATLHEDDEEDDSEISVTGYFDAVVASIQRKNQWSVDQSSVVLGFFHFQKLLMYHDLDYETWPEGLGPHTNKIVTSLVEARFNDPGPAIGPDDNMDDRLDPKDIHHVLDADSSQAIVIADVTKGRNLVVQGPPGTGKSQTIVNLIAEGVGKGKKILFVSEKMAALEVVKRRLDSLQLGDVCLELHSNKTTKRAVLDELRRTLHLGEPQMQGVTAALESLKESRNHLNRYASGVNSPIDLTETTLHTSIGRLLSLNERHKNNPLPTVDILGIESWSRSQFEQKLRMVQELQARLETTGIPRQHAFWGTGLRDFNPSDRRRLEYLIEQSVKSTSALKALSERLADILCVEQVSRPLDAEFLLQVGEIVIDHQDLIQLNLSSPLWDSNREDIGTLIHSINRMQELRNGYESVLLPNAWDLDLSGEKQAIAEARGKYFGSGLLRRLLSPGFRRAEQRLKSLWRGDLPRDLGKWEEALEAIHQVQVMSSKISSLAEVGSEILGASLDDLLRRWDVLLPKVSRYLELITLIENGETPSAARTSLSMQSGQKNLDTLCGDRV